MKQIKTIKKNVTFVPVSGNEIYPDFFDEDGKVEVESVIESVYCNSIVKATIGKVDVIKKKLNRGITDGLLRFRYDGNVIEFYGIQECKRDIKRTSNRGLTSDYKKQICQSLLYFTQMRQEEKCKVLVINSVNYFDYILIDENKEFIDEIESLLKNKLIEGTPSKVCKDCPFVDFTKLKIHTCDIPSKEEINNILLNIYRNCV